MTGAFVYHTPGRKRSARRFISIWIVGVLFIGYSLYLNPDSTLYLFLLLAYAFVGIPVLINVVAR